MAGLKQRIAFYTTLATLDEAGIPPLRALQQRYPGAFRNAAARMQEGVAHGLTMSQVMEAQAGLFSSLEISLVRVGEATGRRDTVYRALRDWFQLVWRLRSRVISSLLYPAFLYHASVLLISVISIFADGVTPVRAAWRTGLGLAAPWALWLGWRLVGPGLLAQPALGQVYLALPILGPLWYRLDTTRFFTALALGLRAGIGPIQAVELAAATCRNAALRRRFGAMATTLASTGCSLSEALAGSLQRLDRRALLVELLQTGELAGRTDEAAERIAGLCREEAEDTLNRLAALVPPLLYLGLMIYIGFRIVTFYGRLYAPVRDLLE